MVDTAYVGHAVGRLGLAALQVAVPVQIFMLGMSLMVAVGAASMVSRALGAGRRERATEVAGTSLMLTLVLMLALTAVSLALARPILRLCGAEQTVLPYAYRYLTVVMLGNTFLGIAVLGNQLVRAEGAALVSMVAMMIGAGSNIALDPVFLFVLDMGVQGAALATVLAQSLAALFLLVYLTGSRTALPLTGRSVHLDFAHVPEMLTVGASSVVRIGGDTAVIIAVNQSIQAYAGDLAVIYLGIAGLFMRTVRFISMPVIGVLQGLRAMVGYNYGAGNFRRVRRSILLAAVVNTVISTVGFLCIMLAPRMVLRIFTNEPEILARGPDVFRIVVLLMPLLGLQILGAGLFQAVGRAWPAMLLSLARRVAFVVPLIVLLPLFFGLEGIWYAFPVAEAASALLTIICIWSFLGKLAHWHENGPPDHFEPVRE
jgi:putative MATE family efflux protein